MFYFVDWRTRKSMIFFNFTRKIVFRKKLSDSTFAKAKNLYFMNQRDLNVPKT